MAMTTQQMEKEVKAIKAMVTEIYERLIMGAGTGAPGPYDLNKAIEALVKRRDKKPLERYLAAGGEIPKEVKL